MAGSDPADTHGHTYTIADAQEPELDIAATPASAVQPTTGLVRAQSAAEVTAQIENLPGVDEGS